MASPQKENGYTPIANEIMDVLAKTPIRTEVRRVIDFVLRKTFGFNKKSDNISLSQFEVGTNMMRVNVCRALKEGVATKLLLKDENGYAFNKNFDEWGVAKRLPRIKADNLGGSLVDNFGVATKLPTKDNIKLINTKDITSNVRSADKVRKRKEFQQDSLPYQLASLLFENVRANNEKTKTPNLQAWAADFDLMLRIDGHTQQEVEAIILWSQQDSFWKSNILSASKLREKFPQLWLKAKSQYQSNLIPTI